ncbi:uncharacterized protein MONBRDRAFT_32272 [Monosiga brevicollis MX1]|uniref:UVR domain-containing protein n=1 Tax=Monosiga brevicollis TaxID=81824 RepID=A9UYG7_MONBE|nr:uncharacterized protein MONBRDRAFT_32272 [Monosiga brevicollis MX1]EDQ89458.1 predicted protein [Monosiga brevicollis MX1]|eukprot:XP_001745487.1 hypothetical protein [Monosiga brevicollis MX1]
MAMFGGMNVKGADEEDRPDLANAAASSTGSSFAFINSAPAAAADESAAPSSSAFSFIGGSAASDNAEPAVERIAPAAATPLISAPTTKKKKKRNPKMVRPGHGRLEEGEAEQHSPSLERKTAPSASPSPASTPASDVPASTSRPRSPAQPARATAPPAQTNNVPADRGAEPKSAPAPQRKAEPAPPATAQTAGPTPETIAPPKKSLPPRSASPTASRLPRKADPEPRPAPGATLTPVDTNPTPEADDAASGDNSRGFLSRLFGGGSRKADKQKPPPSNTEPPRTSVPSIAREPQGPRAAPPARMSPGAARGRAPGQRPNPRPANAATPSVPTSKAAAPAVANPSDTHPVPSNSPVPADPAKSQRAKEQMATDKRSQSPPSPVKPTPTPASTQAATKAAAPEPAAPEPTEDASTEDVNKQEPETRETDTTETTVTNRAMALLEEAKNKAATAETKLEELHQERETILAHQLSIFEEHKDKVAEMLRHEEELETAIEAEDYERAEELEALIASLTESTSTPPSFTSARKSTRASLLRLLQQEEQILLDQAATQRESAQTLESSLQEQLDELKTFRSGLEDATRSERARIDAEQMKLQRGEAHLHVDQQHLQEAVDRLESLAAERTAEFQDARRRLVDDRERVRREIAELERKLREARHKEERLEKDIAKEDERIAAAEQDLVAERSQVEAQRSLVNEQAAELDARRAAIQEAQQSLDDSTASARKQVEDLDEAANEVKMHIVQSRLGLRRLEKRTARYLDLEQQSFAGSDRLDDILQAFEEANEAIQSLDAQVAAKTSDIQELSTNVLQLQQDVSLQRKQATSIADQLPELTQAKKLAVGSRNFKEASRLNAEITSLAEQQSSLEAVISEREEELKRSTTELEQAQTDADQLRSELEQARRDRFDGIIEDLAGLYGELFGEARRRRRRKQPSAALVQADADLCHSLLVTLCGAQGTDMPALAEDPETDEAPSTDDEEMEDNADLGVIAASLIDFGDDGLEAGSPEAASSGSPAGDTEQEQPLVAAIADDLLSLDLNTSATADEQDNLDALLDDGEDDQADPESPTVETEDAKDAEDAEDAKDTEDAKDAKDAEDAASAPEEPMNLDASIESVRGDDVPSDAGEQDERDAVLESEDVQAEIEDEEMEASDASSHSDGAEDPASDAEAPVDGEDVDDVSVSEEAANQQAKEERKAQLAEEIWELEQGIERAVENEDFDLCEEMDDKVKVLSQELVDLGVEDVEDFVKQSRA